MKRYLKYFFIILSPYWVVMGIVGLTQQLFPQWLGDSFALSAPLFYIAALISSIVILITSLVKKRDALELVRMNMIIKLVHIPPYLVIFFAGLVGLSFIKFWGVTFIMWVVDLLLILTTGIIGLTATIRALSEMRQTRSTLLVIIMGFLQFIFVLDVIAAVILFVLFKRNMKRQQEVQQPLVAV